MTISAIKRLNAKPNIAPETTPMAMAASNARRGQLEAKWEIKDGKLVCRWIVI